MYGDVGVIAASDGAVHGAFDKQLPVKQHPNAGQAFKRSRKTTLTVIVL